MMNVPKWTLQWLSIVLLAVMLVGCASFEPRLEGSNGPIQWQATDLKMQTVDIEDKTIYSFTLLLKDTQGTGVTFTQLTSRFYNSTESDPVHWKKTGSWYLPPNQELRLPLGSYRHCPRLVCRAFGPLAPVWHIVLTGTDDQGQPRQLVTDIRLPYHPERYTAAQ